jgi:hypothetical protein
LSHASAGGSKLLHPTAKNQTSRNEEKKKNAALHHLKDISMVYVPGDTE